MSNLSTQYQIDRISHWDRIIVNNFSSNASKAYRQRLIEIYQHLIPSNASVLELGCKSGDLLAALQPAYGIGIDFSSQAIEQAQQRYPQFTFLLADAHESLQAIDKIKTNIQFDVIILSDLVNDLWDVQRVFEELHRLSAPHTRIILNSYSRLWEIPLEIVRKLGFANPVLPQNWLVVEDIINLLSLSGFSSIRAWTEILLPIPLPIIAPFANKVLAKLPILRNLALTNFILARPLPRLSMTQTLLPSVSVIVPARNEAGNIAQIFQRVPRMGSFTELIFVEGHSKDDTYTTIQTCIAQHPEWQSRLFQQTGVGKGDAVRLGFQQASGDIVMILDADLTVSPEDLPRFSNALLLGHADFANGVRLVYPMEEKAMRFANILGNKFFSLAFSWLLGQPIKDTLCGTKVLWRKDYLRIAENRHYFGDFDPFGDYDLIFGAAKLNLKIVDIPIRYRERTYGSTNIQRWKHGWLLLRMVAFAAKRIKFV